MLIDLKSAQSTFINKVKCEIDTFHRLFVGDLIKFGGSTRQYIICGPDEYMRPEYDSENLQSYRKKLVSRTQEIEKKKVEFETSGISWGFGEDAENDDDEDDEEDEDEKVPSYLKNDENYERKYGKKFQTDVKESDVHEKDRY